MPKGLVIYYSRSGNVERLAEAIAGGMRGEGLETDLKRIGEPVNLKDYKAIVVGSPTQYGSMAWEVKKFLDETAGIHYALDGVVGGAFTSSCHVGGGNETTILDILHAMLIHGMIIQGEPMYDHYGATGLNGISGDTLMKAERYGKRIAGLTKKI